MTMPMAIGHVGQKIMQNDALSKALYVLILEKK